MKRVLNFGSINVDHVYTVEHFVRPGETVSCRKYRRFAGGKGLNQSIALAQAGACVCHAGKVGAADAWLKMLMEDKGVDTGFVQPIDGPSGHAIIQVNAEGENSIIIVGGANQLISESDVQSIVADFGSDDYLLVQNEVNAVPQIIQSAKAKGLTVVFNPAPMNAQVLNYPLELVDILIVNEIEAQALTGESEPDRIGEALSRRFPQTAVVLTLGDKGASYFSSQARFFQPAEKVHAVDTTGAGDTFIGFFLAELIKTSDSEIALQWAARAAAICITRHGAADSIPSRKELEAIQ
ncbi:ribokinase [Methylobacter sp. YRD-M1]|uniref:ribokinase n=1 Tax=Methylobacter sp. YRD-M1 TaxID=2911520 RepID=UPI00227CDBCC|nr:ribokinase [Methylobacter sp. YRD-M1]WAK01035.1 ribokinase [Methylobacter sp. YRD-M1]